MFKANDKNTDVLVFLMFLLLTLNIIQTFTVSIIDFKQVNVSRERLRNIPGVFLINSFHATDLSSYPLKTRENLWRKTS